MTARPIDVERARALLDYDKETGVFRWKPRTTNMFVGHKFSPERCCNLWNAQWAGNVAGGISKQSGYLIIKLDAQYHAHAIAWAYVYGDRPDGKFVDHINGDRSDNRICNLRLATKAQNGMNRGKQSNNTSGMKGVSWAKNAGKWSAHIKINRKKIHLGLFNNIEHAAAAYDSAAISLHGEFARTNFEVKNA
jgi:hypothetical protein